MENATKALLIVAAVLIAIILVAMSINLLNSTGDTSDSAQQVGDRIIVEADDVSRDVISILDDLNNKNLTYIDDRKEEFNWWYQNYFPKNPKLLLEPSTTYILSFDYRINYADSTVGCGIGYGKTHYSKDILYSVTYPNQTEGTFVKTFTTPSTFNTDEPYLQLRFARMNQPGKLSVEIENVRFKKVQ